MKKFIGIFAAALMAMSLFACEAKTTKTRIANVPYSTTRVVRSATPRTAVPRTVKRSTRNTTNRSAVTRSNTTARNTTNRNAAVNRSNTAAAPRTVPGTIGPYYNIPGAVPYQAPYNLPLYTGMTTPFNVAR